jgi:ABC-2 type transport system permease protein
MAARASVRPGPELREVPGPAAVSNDLGRLWRLVWILGKTQFTSRYQGSAFGFLWSLLNPLLLFGVLYVVFTQIFRLGDTVPHYAALLLLNIMLFQFFADSTSICVSSLVSQEALIRKVEFPHLAVPLSVILASTFTLGLDLVVVITYMLIAGVPVTATWLLLPVLVLWLYVFTAGTSLLLATLFVFFRDTAQIWQVISRVMFYASPVLLPIELFPAGFKPFLLCNPLAPMFTESRAWLVDSSAPSFGAALGGNVLWIYPTLILITIVIFGSWLFNRLAPDVAEQL